MAGLRELLTMRRVLAVWSTGQHSAAVANCHSLVRLRGVILVKLKPNSRRFGERKLRVGSHGNPRSPPSCGGVCTVGCWCHHIGPASQPRSNDSASRLRPRTACMLSESILGAIPAGRGTRRDCVARVEREGFEPSDPVSLVNALAVRPIRPLSHLSEWTESTARSCQIPQIDETTVDPARHPRRLVHYQHGRAVHLVVGERH